jgi:Mrp family chromosome partitioning ATPase
VAWATSVDAGLIEAVDRALAEESPRNGFARRRRETLSRPVLPSLVLESSRLAMLRLVKELDAGGTLAVVGATRNEGRSIVAAALATSLARDTRERVLLMDLALESPAQAALFHVENSPGLAEYLTSRAPLRLVCGEPERRLVLLPAGSIQSRALRLGGMIGSATFSALRERFNWVVLDLPSISDTPDASLLAACADYRIVVARHRHSSISQLHQIVDLVGDPDSTGLLLTAEKRSVPAWLKRYL